MPEFGFDYNEENTNRTFDPVPPGWYYARIIKSETKETAARTGTMIVLTWELIANEAGIGTGIANRQIFENLNIENPNEQAVQIARQSVDQIRKATGKFNAGSSEELHGIPILIKLKVRPERQYTDHNGVKQTADAQNEVRGYKAVQQTSQGDAQQTSAFAPTPAPAQAQTVPTNDAQPPIEHDESNIQPWLRGRS